MDKLGVAFIGAGFAANFHARGWVGVRNAEIVAICDLAPERAKSFAARCRELGVGNPKTYTDIQETVRDPNVNAVWITVPNYARLDVVKAIVEEVTQGKTNLVGIVCEKPLATDLKTAKEMLQLVEKAGLLHGYLENQVFAPAVVRGKEIVWRRGASITGRPYLARAAEEHSGPHSPWFWQPTKSGGGVLLDMMCHSHEAARFLLLSPDEDKSSLKPRAIAAEIASLKWTRPEYIKKLKESTGNVVDYSKEPAEDFARSNVIYEAEDGTLCISDVTTSWCYTGPGLRLTFEVLGPEYCLQINTLQPGSYVFFSREVKGPQGEDLVEKQLAEQGLMPVIPDESVAYGYQAEDRHMVESFLQRKMPFENWNDGVFVMELLMASYMAAEKGRKLKFPISGLEEYKPKVAKGEWKPRSVLEVE
ncbi:MAG: gfo/Idh/MocA family oxidoreductase [Thaumarchaeota archaeon]|nr:MAG: gfo/Idh/MocA family oxidoreductase [Nitrososphaerota archaeon]